MLAQQGKSIKAIARELGVSRNTMCSICVTVDEWSTASGAAADHFDLFVEWVLRCATPCRLDTVERTDDRSGYARQMPPQDSTRLPLAADEDWSFSIGSCSSPPLNCAVWAVLDETRQGQNRLAIQAVASLAQAWLSMVCVT